MKIKVGDKVYSGEQEPIMVILTEQDKKNIGNMIPGSTKYCVYPKPISKEVIEKFMKVEE